VVYHRPVIPRVVIERVPLPGGETLVLSRRDQMFSIRVAGVELMNNASHHSEDELGKQCARRVKAKAPKIMIGGLGMGFTLRAALDELPADARVEVVEIVPAVVRWNRTILGDQAGHPLDDPRVTVVEDDVREAIARGKDYDAIVLDVDNGPNGVYEGNGSLYKRAALAQAKAALAPGGVYAVWSSFASPTFSRWLRDVGFKVDEVTVKSHGGHHIIWFAS